MDRKKKVYIIIAVICMISLAVVYRTRSVAQLNDITAETEFVEINIRKHYDGETSSLKLFEKEDIWMIQEAILDAECRYRRPYRLIQFKDQALFNLSLIDADQNPYIHYTFLDDGRVYSGNGYYVLTGYYADDYLTKILEDIMIEHQAEVY